MEQPISAKGGNAKTTNPPSRFALCVTGLACLSVAAVLLAAAWRGATPDEYATYYFGDPAVAFSTAWTQLWPAESDPPFFYMLVRIWEQFTGPGLFAHRMINLPALCFLAAWFGVAAWRQPAQRPFLACYALFAFTGKFFILHFPEYRSYFWQYCAGLVFLGAASLDYLEHRRRPNLFQLAALPVLLLLHEVTCLYAGVLLAFLLWVDWRRRHYLRVACLALAALLPIAALGLFGLRQARALHGVLGALGWITPRGPLDAFVTIAIHLLPDLSENWVALLLAAFIAASPLYRPRGEAARLIRLIAGAAAAATLAALVVNSRAPLVVDRYFSLLAVELIAIISLTIGPLLTRVPRLSLAVTANAAIYLLIAGIAGARPGIWAVNLRHVSALAAACPGSRIYVGTVMNTDARIALAQVAARTHLPLMPAPAGPPGRCPAIFWAAYRAPAQWQIERRHGDIAAAANATAGFRLSPAELAVAKIIPDKAGTILILPPHP